MMILMMLQKTIFIILATSLWANNELPSTRPLMLKDSLMSDSIQFDDSVIVQNADTVLYLGQNNEKTERIGADEKGTLDQATKWNRNTFWATFFGIILTLATIIAMIVIHKKQSKDTKDEIKQLENQNKNATTLIRNQEKSFRNESRRSYNLNKSLENNVSDIKRYMMDKDLVIKIKEKKSSIYNTFMFISSTSFSGSELKKGTLLKNHDAMLNAAIEIIKNISIIGELLPEQSDSFIRFADLCREDMESLSEEQEDVILWITDAKSHFTQLDNELDVLINNLINK